MLDSIDHQIALFMSHSSTIVFRLAGAHFNLAGRFAVDSL
jgi:hypothetical protein